MAVVERAPDTGRPPAAAPEPSRDQVWRMFDRIAPRYDLLNRSLSLGRDVGWRRRLAGHLPEGEALSVLDLATGTGDQLLMLWDQSRRLGEGVGIDLAEKMLELGRAKVRSRGLDGAIRLETGDAMAIPFPGGVFDAVTMSFGIRNVTDVGGCLEEMLRVLRPGGRALILEFSTPRWAPLRWLYLLYLRHVLPRIGAAVSGDGEAYRYLDRTVEGFPCGEAFCDRLRRAGFVAVDRRELTFGIATLYQGDRPMPGGGRPTETGGEG